MKLWIGSIIDAAIGNEFREIRNSIEEKVNSKIEHTNYGLGLSTWDVILCVRHNPPVEYVKYNKTTRETDIRLIVDFDTFLQIGNGERAKMIAEELLKSISLLSQKNIKDFDFNRLAKDVYIVLSEFIYKDAG